jgi:predicted O-methyltransferase YrrM
LFTALPAFDFVLIDGDHRGEALKSYFQTIKPRLSQNAIVMIDDIRWSEDMFKAWKDILHDDTVTCSLDYFKFGLLFFRKDFLEKVHFQIKV